MINSWQIKNFEQLAKTPARQTALWLAETALKSIATQKAIQDRVKLIENVLFIDKERFPLNPKGKIILIGVGKCASEASNALEKILQPYLADGVVIDLKLSKKSHLFSCFVGDHPLPSDRNIEATRQLIALLKQVRSEDLVLFVISGGGSTLLCQPGNAMSIEEKTIMSELIRQGASIQEINTLRKHLSLARGGWLAYHAFPAQVISLIFSDISGNDLSLISSGPTVKDETTIPLAWKIAEKYNLPNLLKFQYQDLLETPKDDKYFNRVKNILFISNQIALEAMKVEAEKMGYRALICDQSIAGEAKTVGETLANILHNTPARSVLLYGGETTVKIKGGGKGGRNQELCLSALPLLQPGELILSLATDGQDNGEAAGAIADERSLASAQVLGLKPSKYLADNNSGEFFKNLGQQLLTGSTGANVSDLIIAIKD